MLKKSQIIGILVVTFNLTIGLLWEKNFKYAGFLDFLFGVLAAIGISMVFKILPILRKIDK